MDYNKGRFVPTINPLNIFAEADARTPFDGELCLDTDTNDICFWRQNSNTNAWESVSRTKEIQNYLDKYEEDTTFPAAKAFIANDVIHRLFYNKETLKCWLDDSFDFSKYAYFAIKSTYKINGDYRYMTGAVPHDGTDATNALYAVGTEKCSTVFEMLPNKWYSVELYNSNKAKQGSVNFISYPVKSMPIEKNLKESESKFVGNEMVRSMDSRLTRVYVKFNQSLGENHGYIFKNQPVSALKATIMKMMSGGHVCSEDGRNAVFPLVLKNTSDIQTTVAACLSGFEAPEKENREFLGFSTSGTIVSGTEELNSTVIKANSSKTIYMIYSSTYESRIKLDGFEKINNSILGDYSCNVEFTYIDSGVNSDTYKVEQFTPTVLVDEDYTVTLEKTGTRSYVSVSVEPIGEAVHTIISLSECTVVSGETEDTITIPKKYFGLGRNSIKISYTETNSSPLVKVDDFKLTIPVTVTVKEDNYVDIDKFIPAGYLTNPDRGLYYINLKYFAHYEDGHLEDVTDRVITVKSIDKSKFGETQSVTVKIQVDRVGVVFKTYDFNIFCADPTTNSYARVIINGDTTPRILFYDGSKFTLGIFDANLNQSTITIDSLLNSNALMFNGKHPTHIRVREIETSSKIYTKLVDNVDDLIYLDKFKIPLFLSPTKDYLLGGLLDSLSHKTYDNYTYQYYSINGGESAITADERNIVCPKNKLVTFKVNGETVYPMEVHTKNSSTYNVLTDKPFLVEAFYKDETTGRYVCTGALIHYAERIKEI